MISGSTQIYLAKLEGIDIEAVDKIIFTFKGLSKIQKVYPTEVTYSAESELFAIPMTQRDTLNLCNPLVAETLIDIEAQINYSNGSVSKQASDKITVSRSIATQQIESENPLNPAELTFKIIDNVVVAQVNAEGIDEAVEQSLASKHIEENIDKLLENGESTDYEYTLEDVGSTEGIYIKNGEERANDQYIASGYFPIAQNTQILIENIDYSASNRQIALYDADKNYIGNATIISQTSTISSVVNVVFSTSDASFARVSSLAKYKDTYPVKASYTVSSKIYATMQDIDSIFTSSNSVKLASQIALMSNTSHKKIITWVDDDANSDSYVANVKAICDELGIKCTFATITGRWGTAQSASVATLKALQEEGFHITTHTGDHTRWYKADGDLPMFTEAQCEADLIKSLSALVENGFIDSNYLIYAGSSASRTDADIVKLCRKWCEAGVLPSGTSFTKYADGRYKINRLFFDKSIRTASTYTNMLDSYTDNDCPWVVFGSHSANAEQFDADMIKTVLQHAIDSGWEIMTLNEAYKIRRKFFEIQEFFGA